MSPALPGSFSLKPSGADRSWLHRSGATATTPKEKVSQLQPSSLHVEQQVWDRRGHCVSQHRTLTRRAGLIRRRVRALLGEHTVQHVVRQLNTLRGQCLGTDALPAAPSRLPDKPSFLGIAQAGLTHALPSQDATRHIQHLASCVQVVMREAQLDSDATESSSDEEPVREVTPGPQRAPVRRGREWRWLAERAEIGSRWAWLQLQEAELGAQIQTLDTLHRRIISSKGLQPLAGDMVHQACPVPTGPQPSPAHPCHSHDFSSDLEAEPSSPTRLLRNIEMQSAQLAQIVSRLTDPLCSPHLTLPGPTLPSGWTHKTRVVHPKKHQTRCNTPKPSQSARTRPLLTYQKRRLFTFDPGRPDMQQPRLSMPLLPAREPSLACPLYDSCQTLAVSTEPSCSREAPVGVDERRWAALRPHPVLSLSSETSLSLYLQSALCRETRARQPALVPIEGSSPCFLSRDVMFNTPPVLAFSSILKCQRSHREVSPFTRRGQRKRRHSSWSSEGRERGCQSCKRTERDDAEPCSNPSTGTEDSPAEATFPQGTLARKLSSTQGWTGWARRRRLSFDIDDVIIPVSLATATKREESQQKLIITPSWSVVELEPLDVGEEGPVGVEALSDEVFAHRHLPYEAAERLRWSSWECGRSRRQSDSSFCMTSDLWGLSCRERKGPE